jgi:hypothetical protein
MFTEWIANRIHIKFWDWGETKWLIF